jgi:6-pyruvoyltetrahydropterin/6-carboxytetrahydropterin synthase
LLCVIKVIGFWPFNKLSLCFSSTMMIYVSRQEHFNAAHKLYNVTWTKEKNSEVFGPCANENWHGHNYDLIVTVKGRPAKETGFVIDLKKLSDLIKAEVIEKVDHKNLNLDVEFMRGKMASTENLAIEIWKILHPKIMVIAPEAVLHSVKLYETPRNYVEYFGGQ